jgi:hypothetical protein
MRPNENEALSLAVPSDLTALRSRSIHVLGLFTMAFLAAVFVLQA